MKNIYKIVWSDEALKNLQEIIEYLEKSWTETEIRNFARLLDKYLNLLHKNPFLFSKDPELHSLRKAVISKQTSIYYRIVQRQVHIITLFDNRQDPQNLGNKEYI